MRQFPALNQPNGSPDWMRSFVISLNGVLLGLLLPRGPVSLAPFVAGAGAADPARTLPPPASTPNALVFVTDIGRLAVSNGVNWIRQDTGAAI